MVLFWANDAFNKDNYASSGKRIEVEWMNWENERGILFYFDSRHLGLLRIESQLSSKVRELQET